MNNVKLISPDECKKLGIHNVLIVPRKDNIGSNKVIQNNEFTFECETEHD